MYLSLLVIPFKRVYTFIKSTNDSISYECVNNSPFKGTKSKSANIILLKLASYTILSSFQSLYVIL